MSLIKSYADMVSSLAKGGDEILESLTPQKVEMWHMASGVGGEGGEVLDEIKKIVAYNRPVNAENKAKVVKELGDLEFYMEGLRQSMGISREECLEDNMNKLGQRYDGFNYSDTAANERKDVK